MANNPDVLKRLRELDWVDSLGVPRGFATVTGEIRPNVAPALHEPTREPHSSPEQKPQSLTELRLSKCPPQDSNLKPTD